jgi:hypothetical protein
MLEITLTPTLLAFRNLDDETANKLHDYGLQWNDKNKYHIRGDEKTLFKILLKLSYTYDIEIY